MQQTRQTSRRTSESELDWGIILALLLFMIIGLSSLYEAATHMHGATTLSAVKVVMNQGIFWFIGVLLIVFLVRFDGSQLWKLAPITYGLGIFLLVAVLIFYNRAMYDSTGARSWFVIGPLSFQPSEVVKPAFILMLSRVVAQHNRNYPNHALSTDWLLLGKMAVCFIPVAALIALQNDLGTLLVFVAIFGGVALVSGVTWRILAPVIILGATVGTTLLTLIISSAGRTILSKLGFQSYQFSRIDTWLNPANDTSGKGYQTYQSLKAIGSGQLTGNGWGSLKVYVPVRESDMIFSVIGESFGFIGGAFLIALYFGLIYLLIRATFRAQSAFYAYIATGVVMMVLFHVFENIGMSIGLLPLTGIPLPFVSQGGSSLLGNMIGVGLILSIGYQRQNSTFTETTGFFI